MPDDPKVTMNMFDFNEPGDEAAAMRLLQEKGIPPVMIESSAEGYRLIFPHHRTIVQCDDFILDVLIESMQSARDRRRQMMAEKEAGR